MNGYKVHHGLPSDIKLAVVAKKAGLAKGEILAIWIAIIDYASQNKPRGSIKNIDIEEIAVTLGFELQKIDAAIKAFSNKRMIGYNKITNWKESQKFPSTSRTRRFKEKQKKNSSKIPNPDSAEEIAKRRARLQKERLLRNKQK